MKHAVCIHADTPFNDPAVSCGFNAHFQTHGFLCRMHYIAQQRSIPSGQRKPSGGRYRGYTVAQETDDQIVRSIITADRDAISTGKIETLTFGKYDPATLRILTQ